MIGKTVSHYKITRELGSGGMGVVYEAVDTKLDRTVALKFLPPESTRDPDAKARFVHEAKAASALDHNNVCVIYEIGETDDGQMFLAMACYEGETLKDRIERGPLQLDDALDITRQVAEGLNKAHEREIVHRDIKPANIFITDDGVVKVLDFGLAKLAGLTQLTQEGTTLGTAHYMSPEQAGGQEVDCRSDLWCLGVVLYEMITGRVPFQGDQAQAVIYAILNRNPEPVTSVRSGVPMELERIIGKCLTKDPAERYQHADDLEADLTHLKRQTNQVGAGTTVSLAGRRPRARWWPWMIGSVLALVFAIAFGAQFLRNHQESGQSQMPMLAVLPFENLGRPSDAYFADGVTDEILTKLSVVPGIGVIARESSFQFRDGAVSIKEVGDRLGADFILMGTIRWQMSRDGRSRVRVTPKLVSVENEQSLWAEAYEEDLDQIFEVQAKIGKSIVRALNISLLEDDKLGLENRPTDDLEAYVLFLRAKELLLRAPDKERFAEAGSLLSQVLDRDPGFSAAHAWSSMLYSDMHHYVFDRSNDILEMARDAWEKALFLDPDLPDALLAKGRYHYYANRDYPRAQAAFEAVVQNRPNDWLAIHYTGVIKKRQGRFHEALEWYERAHDRNPASYKALMEMGIVLGYLGQDEEATRTFERVISLWPDEGTPYRAYFEYLMQADGNTIRARPLMEKAKSRLGMEGNEAGWFRILVTERKFQEAFAVAISPLMTSELHHYLGDRDRMMASADSARVESEEKSVDDSGDYFLHLQWGLSLSFMGRKDEALPQAFTAASLMPVDRDAVFGPVVIQSVARIHLLCGDHEKAIDNLEIAMERSPYMSARRLRYYPLWDPLRDNPRFKKLVTETP